MKNLGIQDVSIQVIATVLNSSKELEENCSCTGWQDYRVLSCQEYQKLREF